MLLHLSLLLSTPLSCSYREFAAGIMNILRVEIQTRVKGTTRNGRTNISDIPTIGLLSRTAPAGILRRPGISPGATLPRRLVPPPGTSCVPRRAPAGVRGRASAPPAAPGAGTGPVPPVVVGGRAPRPAPSARRARAAAPSAPCAAGSRARAPRAAVLCAAAGSRPRCLVHGLLAALEHVDLWVRLQPEDEVGQLGLELLQALVRGRAVSTGRRVPRAV